MKISHFLKNLEMSIVLMFDNKSSKFIRHHTFGNNWFLFSILDTERWSIPTINCVWSESTIPVISFVLNFIESSSSWINKCHIIFVSSYLWNSIFKSENTICLFKSECSVLIYHIVEIFKYKSSVLMKSFVIIWLMLTCNN